MPSEPLLNELKVECFEPHQAFTVGESLMRRRQEFMNLWAIRAISLLSLTLVRQN